MKLVIDDSVTDELKEYLLTQTGIIDVELNKNNYLTTLDIKHNEKTTPYIIMKYIELFQDSEFPILFEFNKGIVGNYKKLQYTIENLCCDYCYRGLVMDLFDNKNIKSVKSNFDCKMSTQNVEFIIEYDERYKEEELIEYIQEMYK